MNPLEAHGSGNSPAYKTPLNGLCAIFFLVSTGQAILFSIFRFWAANSESGIKLTVEFKHIFFEVKDKLWNYLLSITGDPDLADDIFQSTFLKVIPVYNRGSIRNEAVKAYLFRTAYNEFISTVRKNKSERNRFSRMAEQFIIEEDPDAKAADPYYRDQSEKILEILVLAINDPKLPDRQRDLLQLRLFGQLSVDEIVTVLQVSRRTVYRDLKTALDFLQQYYKEQGLTPEDLQ